MTVYPIFKSLGTLAVLLLIGWISRRRRILSREDTKVLASFLYYCALPALFFAEMGRIDYNRTGAGPVILSLMPPGIICGLLVLLRVPGILSKDRFILCGLSIAFGSNAFFGVPFFEALYGQWGLDISVLTGAVLSIFGLLASVSLFEYAVHSGRGIAFIGKVFRSPLILSVAAGLLVSLWRPSTSFVFELLMPLGRTAPGLAVFMLGMFVHDHFSPAAMKKALPFAICRIVLLPLVTVLCLFVIGHPEVSVRRFVLLQSGIPAAISIAIFAQRYQYKTGELTGMVVSTSLAAFPTLLALYALGFTLFP